MAKIGNGLMVLGCFFSILAVLAVLYMFFSRLVAVAAVPALVLLWVRREKSSERMAHTVVFWSGLASVVFLLFVFLRDFHWFEGVSLAAIYGGVCWQWVGTHDLKLGQVVRQGLVNAVLLGMSLVVVLLLAELGARALYGAPPPIDIGSTQPHPVRVATLTPNFDGVRRFNAGNAMKEIPITYSSQGLRDEEIPPKKPGEFRIFMLGDSYTAGLTMVLEETIPKQLQAELRRRLPGRKITVINGGVPGYGPWQERDLLLELGFPLEPDLVIQQVLPANDIDNTLCRAGKYPESYNRKWRQRYFYQQNRTKWQVAAERWLAETSMMYALVASVGERHYVIEALNHLRFLPPLPLPELPESAPRNPLIEINLREYYPVLQEGWEMMQEDMRGIRDDCRERGTDFMVYSVPVQHAVDENWWKHTTNGMDIYERGKDSRIIREFCGRENIPFIDIRPAIKNHPDISALYYNPNGHFKPEGSSVVARTIADYLCKHYFTDSKCR